MNFSCGEYVFCSTASLEHELGHTRQSRMLGPLYLIVVGLPSIARWVFNRFAKRGNDWYLSGFPESWAERLKPKVTFYADGRITVAERDG